MESPPRPRLEKAKIPFLTTAVITGVMLVLLLAIDHALSDFWELAFIPFLWGMLGLYLGVPLCVILAFIRRSREAIGVRLLLLNVAGVAALVLYGERSISIDALMRV